MFRIVLMWVLLIAGIAVWFAKPGIWDVTNAVGATLQAVGLLIGASTILGPWQEA